jgi:hypothetical protein
MNTNNVNWASNGTDIKLLQPKTLSSQLYCYINGAKCRFQYQTHIIITIAEGAVWNQQPLWECGATREQLLFAV